MFSWWVPVPTFSWSSVWEALGFWLILSTPLGISMVCIFLDWSCYKKKIVCYRFDGWFALLFLGLLYAELSGLGPEKACDKQLNGCGSSHCVRWLSPAGMACLGKAGRKLPVTAVGHWACFGGFLSVLRPVQDPLFTGLIQFGQTLLEFSCFSFCGATRAWDPCISPFSGILCRDSCQL